MWGGKRIEEFSTIMGAKKIEMTAKTHRKKLTKTGWKEFLGEGRQSYKRKLDGKADSRNDWPQAVYAKHCKGWAIWRRTRKFDC